ncbi:MAG: permease-like cell division protein FtsX [Peptostreptococcaceae bacterium]
MKLVSSFFYSIKQGIKGFFTNKAMSFISVVSVSAALTIFGIVLSVVLNINQFISIAKDQVNEIRVAIDTNLSTEEIEILKNELIKLPQVKEIQYKSKEASFSDMKKSWGEDAYLLDGVDNPLDDFYVITIENPEDIKSVAKNILSIPGAMDVEYYYDIMQNFLNISNTVKKFGGIFICFLLLICLVLISNTIKSRVLSKKEEIQIIKYVGASNNFVIAPFIVEGFAIGMIGSLLSISTCILMYNYVIENIDILMDSIMGNSIISITSISFILCIVLVITGVSVGVVGSIVSVKKHLKV